MVAMEVAKGSLAAYEAVLCEDMTLDQPANPSKLAGEVEQGRQKGRLGVKKLQIQQQEEAQGGQEGLSGALSSEIKLLPLFVSLSFWCSRDPRSIT